MNRAVVRLLLPFLLLVLFPTRCPAPLTYRAGEGWVYEPVGGGKWMRTRAKDQLQVAQEAFDAKNYSQARKAARRTVSKWPLSDYAPRAQYLVGRCYEAKRQDQRAFKEYQKLLERYPKNSNYEEVTRRQFEIANRFLAGQRFKLFGVIPLFPSMEKTVDMYSKIIRNGPYSDVAPEAQMNVGKAREKQKDYPLAVRAYQQAADRYRDRPVVAADGLFKAGLAWHKQAQRAEYDQGAAVEAITAFTDFMALYPEDPRAADAAKRIDALRIEQARGSFETALYYEKKRRWKGALIYYNQVVALLRDKPTSPYAEEAKRRLEAIQKRIPAETTTKS